MKSKGIVFILCLLLVLLFVSGVGASDADDVAIHPDGNINGDIAASDGVNNPYISANDDGGCLFEANGREQYDAEFSSSKALNNVFVRVSDVTYGEDCLIEVSADADGDYIVGINGTSYDVAVNNGFGFKFIGLQAGSYSTKTTFNNDSYETVIEEADFEVRKADNEIVMSADDVIYGSQCPIYIACDIDGVYVLNINGTPVNVTVRNHAGSYIADNLDAGLYNVSISYPGDRNINPNNVSVTFNVLKAQNNAVVIVGDVIFGEDSLIKVYADVDGEYVVDVNGTGHVVCVEDGLGNKTITLNSGVYYANLAFDNGNYNTSVDNTIFNVYKINTGISIVYDVGNDEIVATITNGVTGSPISGANIKVKLNGAVTSIRSDSKGQVKLSTADLEFGNYSVTVSYKGNSKYNGSERTVDIAVKTNVVISAVYDAEACQIVATLTNSVTGSPVSGANLKVKLNGTTTSIKSNSNGQVKVSTVCLDLGNYSASVSYKGNSKYDGDATTIDFVVKYNVVISAVYDAEACQIVATVTNAGTGAPISGANIKVNLNGETYALKTRSKGQIMVSTADLDLGNYTAKISYKGNGKYNAAATAIDFAVKSNTDISAVYDSKSKQIVATLTDENGDAIGGVDVSVSLDGKTYNLKTDSNGQVNVSTADLSIGSYSTAVSYKGDCKYNPSDATIDFVVKYDVVISAVYDAESDELVVGLTNFDTGAPISGANVKIFLNGETYALKTYFKGQVNVSTSHLWPGNYTATVSYYGNGKYNGARTTAEVIKQ